MYNTNKPQAVFRKGAIAMNQMSFKNVFYKILFSEKQREKMTSLKDIGSAYELFCKNGYSKSLDEFKKEINNFFSSSEGQKIMNNNFDELSDEMLEKVAGGADLKRVMAMCASGLMAACMASGSMASVGAIDEKDIFKAREAVTACNQTVKELEKKKEEAKRDKDRTIIALKQKYKIALESDNNASANGPKQKGKTLSAKQKVPIFSLKNDYINAKSALDNASQKYDKIINNLNKAIDKAKKEQDLLNKRVEELMKQAEKERQERERQQKIEKERLEKERLEKERLEKEKEEENERLEKERLEKERQRKIKKQENKEMTKEELQKAREDAQTRLSKYYFAAKRELDESLIKDTEDWKKADDGIYSTLNNAIRQIIYTYSIQEDINKEIDLAERTVKDMMNKCRQQEKQKLKREIEELEKNITLLRRERDEKHEKTRQARQEFGIWNRPKEERKQCEYNLGEAEAQERKAQRALEDALTTQAHKIEKLQKVEKKLMSDEERKKMEEEIAKDIERMRKEEQERKKQQKLEEEKQERERLEAEKWVDNSVEQVKQERLKKEKNTKTEVRVNKSTLEEVQQERITREKNQIIKRTPEEKYIRAEDMKAAYALIEHRHETAKIEKDFKAVEKLAEEKFDQERKELCQPFIAKKDSLSNEYRKKHGIKYQEYIERYNEIEKEEKEAETEAYKKYQKILKIIQIKCREMICKSYERYEKFCKEMGRTSVEL